MNWGDLQVEQDYFETAKQAPEPSLENPSVKQESTSKQISKEVLSKGSNETLQQSEWSVKTRNRRNKQKQGIQDDWRSQKVELERKEQRSNQSRVKKYQASSTFGNITVDNKAKKESKLEDTKTNQESKLEDTKTKKESKLEDTKTKKESKLEDTKTENDSKATKESIPNKEDGTNHQIKNETDLFQWMAEGLSKLSIDLEPSKGQIILKVFDIPKGLKAQDVQHIFRAYQDCTFHFNQETWTAELGFNTRESAEKALKDPRIYLKRKIITKDNHQIESNISDSSKPSTPLYQSSPDRPSTSAHIAHRLITNSLGLPMTPRNPNIVAREKKLLAEARQNKRNNKAS